MSYVNQDSRIEASVMTARKFGVNTHTRFWDGEFFEHV